MTQPQPLDWKKFSPLSITLIIVAVAVAVTFLIAPEATKPLFLKYYRTMYSAELVRHS